MHLPFGPPFSDEWVIANPCVQPIVDALVSEECTCHFVRVGTPLPGA
jgi:hypothetical protein